METLLGLAVLTGASGGLLYAANRADQERRYTRARQTTQKSSEGFQPLINPTVDSILPDDQKRLITETNKRFNPLVNTFDSKNNPLLPPNYTTSDIQKAQAKVTGAVRRAIAKPSDPSYSILMDTKPEINIGGGIGNLQKNVQQCEAVKSVNCEKLKEAKFGTNCGICLAGGQGSDGKPILGGLYVTPEDINSAEVNARRMSSRTVNYKPTLGSCEPGKFAVTYDQCVRIKNQMECERSQSFGGQGCSQCTKDNRFYFVDPSIPSMPLTFKLVGSGDCSINVSGSSPVKLSLSSTPQETSISIAEGSAVTMSVTPPSGATEAMVAGYVSGPVGVGGTGAFQVDIGRLAEKDLVSNGKPRIAGFYTIDGTTYSAIRNGRGKSSMSLQLFIPYTFYDPLEADTQQCSGGPFITKAESATKLGSGTCYKAGSGPGNYSLECLQQTFYNNGCANEGNGLPSTQEKANQLMFDKSGNPLALGAISQNIYETSVRSETGKSLSGTDLSVSEWDSASYFCTGKRIRNACDTSNKNSGPLSAECISYLYNNGGANNSDIGPTYMSGNRLASLGSSGSDQFCSPNGTISPTRPSGGYNEANVLAARAKGGIDAVKKFYSDIHKMANDNTLSDGARREAIKQCYGIDLGSISQTDMPIGNRSKIAEKPEVFYAWTGGHPYSVSKAEASGVCASYGAQVATTAQVEDAQKAGADWCATGWVSDNANAIYPITTRTQPGCGGGSPGIKVWTPDQGWFRQTGVPNDGQNRAGVNCYGVKPPPGTAKVNPFNESRWSQSVYVDNVFDSKEGRQFSSRQYPPNYTAVTATNSVYVLGSLGTGPWGAPGGYWVNQTPTNFGTQWIWAEPNAQQNASAYINYSFIARVTNPGQSQTVTIYCAIDNIGSILINNRDISGRFGGYKKMTFSLPPGESQVEVQGMNEGGPAGIYFLMLGSNGQPLLKTDATWKWRRV